MRRLFLTIAALAALACGGSSDTTTAPVVPTVNGTWVENVTGIAVTLTLLEVSGDVFGTGQLIETVTYPLTVSGSDVAGNFNLTLASPGLQSVTFAGTVNATTMSGTFTGSGFTGKTVILTKQ